MKGIFYQVCIPHTKRDYFSYYGIEDSLLKSGVRVWVPFGKKTRLGLVIGLERGEPKNQLKPIISLIDEKPLVSGLLLKLARWVANYYQAPLSEIIPLILPKKYRLGQQAQLPFSDYYQLILSKAAAYQCIPSNAHKQKELIDFLDQQNQPTSVKAIHEQGFKRSQCAALLKAKVIKLTTKLLLPQPKNTLAPPLQLNPEQEAAVTTISANLKSYHCFLLSGVTGSGKTEVYLQVIEKVLAAEKQVLVLVPEIGLTPQLLARFTLRFNEPIAVIHSNLNESERQQAWQRAKDNLVKLIIGTRTAVFTPLPTLGLIIIDEEHDNSLKQMEGVRYSARDTALMRAYLTQIPIILGSATPSLESVYNCQQKKYSMLSLTQKAKASTPLHYQLLDIRNVPLQEGLAATTVALIKEHLQKNEQVLVFINRRGFAPVLLCHNCGWMADCSACDSHATVHRKLGRLVCHHCGATKIIPRRCSQCKSEAFIAVGAGTQRIFEYLQQCFPHTSLLRIDRDTITRKKALERQLEQINSGAVQLIVGTQMLAKGHHFPRLTLVVILEADSGFYNQDFRATERLGQLITQVSGRSGRAQFAGKVLMQTHLPHHPLLNLLIQQGYHEFAKALLAIRQEAQFPPYYFLALIRAQDKQLTKVLNFLQQIKELLLKKELQVLGPAPAPLARKAGQHRLQLLLKSSSRKHLQTNLTELREWLTKHKLINCLRWHIDVDPVDLS